MNQSIYTEYKDLLAEELTSEEVFDLLERLSARDLGGSELPTLGAVVEATNAHPVEVGRLLAQIRKEDFEERFGLQLKHHERRIYSVENKTRELERVVQSQASRSQPTPSHYRQTPEVRPLNMMWEEDKGACIIFIMIVLIIGGVLIASSLNKPSDSDVRWEPTPMPESTFPR